MIIIDLFLDLRSLLSRDPLAEFLTVEKPLENKVRTALACLAGSCLKELFAERTATQMIDGLHITEDEIPFLPESVKMGWHARYCI